MKNSIALFVLIMILANISSAQAQYLEDLETLGYVSGEGLACGANKYKRYELIARAFLVSSAKSDKEQLEGMYKYNEAKADGYITKRHDGLLGCDEVRRRFDKQKIFNTKIYKNGTLKMPDGKIIKPRKKYDPTALYKKDSNEREELNQYYDKIVAQKKQRAKEQGIYDKIRQEEMKNRY
jgi:hypothetical protein